MIRQIRRLSRTIVVNGEPLRAIAVYMARQGDRWALDVAQDRGYEGVACVDDAARAAVLFLEAARRFDLPWALEEARGYLRFVGALQQPDGRFANFILDWQGRPNLSGVTSRPDGPNWNARALRALALAAAVTGEATYREAFDRALEPVTADGRYADVRALHALAALDLYEITGEQALRRLIIEWCDQIADCRNSRGDLANGPGERQPHVWGYVQPAALARAAAALRRPDWLRLAEESTLRYLAPLVRSRFPLPTTIAYEVSSVALDLETLARVSGDGQYRLLLHMARDWFRGRNLAEQPVYDPLRGAVGDGIDNGQVNPNSGAESNIEGALALLPELPWTMYEEWGSREGARLHGDRRVRSAEAAG